MLALERELNIKSTDGSAGSGNVQKIDSSDEDNGLTSLETARDIVVEMEKKHEEQTKQYSDELKNMSRTLSKLRKENEDLMAQCKELQAENDELSMALEDASDVESDTDKDS